MKYSKIRVIKKVKEKITPVIIIFFLSNNNTRQISNLEEREGDISFEIIANCKLNLFVFLIYLLSKIF